MRITHLPSILIIVGGIVCGVFGFHNPSDRILFFSAAGFLIITGAASFAFNRWIGKMFGGLGKPQSLSGAMEQAAQNMTNAADLMEMQSRTARLRSEGVSAKARIISAQKTGKLLSNDPMFDFELEISVGGGSPYKVNHSQLVPGFLVSRMIPGSEFNAWVSRINPKELALEWV